MDTVKFSDLGNGSSKMDDILWSVVVWYDEGEVWGGIVGSGRDHDAKLDEAAGSELRFYQHGICVDDL